MIELGLYLIWKHINKMSKNYKKVFDNNIHRISISQNTRDNNYIIEANSPDIYGQPSWKSVYNSFSDDEPSPDVKESIYHALSQLSNEVARLSNKLLSLEGPNKNSDAF